MVKADIDLLGGMKSRTLNIDCEATMAHRLAEAIHAYAHAAYPSGGSECAQVARQALLDSATACASHTGGSLTLRRRQVPMLRAAVRWWLSEDGPGEMEPRPGLESLLIHSERDTC